MGFRAIVDKVDSCYRVMGVLHNLYKPLIQRFKDYIAIPKGNGYQSLAYHFVWSLRRPPSKFKSARKNAQDGGEWHCRTLALQNRKSFV